MQNLNKLLQQKEYKFLADFISKEYLILLTLSGSRAYGTHTEDSDIDIRGIALNSPDEILTMNCREKPLVNTETDTSIFYLKQIITLLAKCNPNTIELLGTREEDLFYLSKEGVLLRNHSHLFLSQIAGHSFGGYAIAQLRRLQNALARDSYPQKEKEKHILETIKGKGLHIETNYEFFNPYDIKLYLDDSKKVDFDKEIFIDINLKHYPLRDLKAISNEYSAVLRDYDSLNHRNNKKDDKALNKHACHLIRLLMTGTDILEGKGIITYREKDLDLLQKLRHGHYVKEGNDYSEVFELVDKYKAKFDYAQKHTELPKKPDYKKINELVSAINRGLILDSL